VQIQELVGSILASLENASISSDWEQKWYSVW
jgi:hypothetical protein